MLTGSAFTFAELPGHEIDVEALFEFVATDVEGDGDFIADGETVEDGGFVLHAFELNHLRVFAVLNFDHEFTLGEAAGESLDVHEVFEGSSEFEIIGHGMSSVLSV